jgi:hypothetical protein
LDRLRRKRRAVFERERRWHDDGGHDGDEHEHCDGHHDDDDDHDDGDDDDRNYDGTGRRNILRRR